MKIVINTCFGGFGLSHDAVMRYAEIRGIKLYFWKDDLCTHYCTTTKEEYDKFHKLWEATPIKDRCKLESGYFSTHEINRTCASLIQVISEMGQAASGRSASLKVVDIPDDVKWTIEEYDGLEHVAEVHRTWD